MSKENGYQFQTLKNGAEKTRISHQSGDQLRNEGTEQLPRVRASEKQAQYDLNKLLYDKILNGNCSPSENKYFLFSFK